jgi:predicted SAM-dependent methyltransferase
MWGSPKPLLARQPRLKSAAKNQIVGNAMDFSNTRISSTRAPWSYSKVQRVVSALIRDCRYFMNLKSAGLYLDVGCGANVHPENINLDYYWRPGVNICCDITHGLPLPSAYVRGIFSEHCLEHVSFSSGLFILKEFHRVTQPGGFVRIIVPDLEIYAQALCNGTKMPYSQSDAIDDLYSPAMSVNRIIRNCGHQFIYDFPTLAMMLDKAGFTEICKRSFAKGRDPKLLLDTSERAVESLYVEGRKPY